MPSEPTKTMSASKAPEERAREVAASLFDGTILTESRMAETIAEAIRAAEAAAYERGKMDGKAEEREACAVICDAAYPQRGTVSDENVWIDGAVHCAEAIRTRTTETSHG